MLRSFLLKGIRIGNRIDEKGSANLHDIGFPDSEVQGGVSVLQQAIKEQEEINSQISDFRERTEGESFFQEPDELIELHNRQRKLKERLDDWLNSREIRVDRVERLALKVPIFILSAPAVDTCSASFSASAELTRNLSCTIKIYGSGIAGGSVVSCQAQCEFSVDAGKAKVVFLPAELTVGAVSVLKKRKIFSLSNKALGQGNNISAIEFRGQPAVSLVPEGVPVGAGTLQTTYSLEGDTTGDISKYRYQYRQSHMAGFSLGAQAFGTDISLKADVTIDQWVELSYELRGGYRYSLHHLESPQGIFWAVDN